MHVNVDIAVCWQHNPRIPSRLLHNSVNKCVKEAKIRAALKTTSCWSSRLPFESDPLRLEEEPLSVRATLSERRLSACMAPKLGILGEKSLLLALGWESLLQGTGCCVC